ncbi:hypothetical protein HDU67_001522 [Dinochytrium kinnereticum]|nr:hypothetical protein HDU67_001522 [Dinochytrium kinnereticum]
MKLLVLILSPQALLVLALSVVGHAAALASPALIQAKCADSCPMVFSPVCGTDGKTYSNDCFLSIANCKDRSIRLKQKGACPIASCEKECSAAIEDVVPVCGSDGKTYTNECFFSIAACKNSKLKVIKVGYCSTDRPRVCRGGYSFCGSRYSPVCGTDGKTYLNECHLSLATCKSSGIRLALEGPCPKDYLKKDCDIMCSSDFKPVCGSDGVTYSNECKLSVASCENPSIKKALSSECPKATRTVEPPLPTTKPFTTSTPTATNSQSPCVAVRCSSTYDPVCGSNGVTYTNPCLLRMVTCRDPSVVKVSKGICTSRSAPPPLPSTTSTRSGPFYTIVPASTECDSIMCSQAYQPVCGSDGITYSNACLLSVASCRSFATRSRVITIVEEGACDKGYDQKQCEESSCASIFQPVCGSDGVTYPNPCSLSVAACKNPSISKASDEACPEKKPSCQVTNCVTGFIAAPVCGSDGKTYPNDCELLKAACEKKGLTKLASGRCPPTKY